MDTVLDRYAKVLLIAVSDAARAPSVRNSQPWRWRIVDRRLELRADPARRPAADLDGHLTSLSCGVALHHARIALAAAGWTARVDRLPDPAEQVLLARLSLTAAGRPDPRASCLLTAARRRHSEHRRLIGPPIPPRALHRMERAVRAEDTRLRVLRQDEVRTDPTALLLYGPVQDRIHWLRAGEALSALLLAAECEGLAAAVLPDETDRHRPRLRLLLGTDGEPFVLVRAGRAPQGEPAPDTPRRDIADIVEFGACP